MGLVSERQLAIAKELQRNPAKVENIDPEPPGETCVATEHRTHQGASAQAMEMSGELRGIFWKHQKLILDYCELLCSSPQQFTTLRRLVQDAQGEQLREQNAYLRQKLMQLAQADKESR
jgi:hypothetical protein